MTDEKPHSNALRQGRFSSPGIFYFITTNVVQRQPLLTPAAREIVIEALRWAAANDRIYLAGYVVMDDHFHALIVLRDQTTLRGVMRDMKRHTSRQINRVAKRAGELWQEGFHDHAIRDEPDLWRHVQYMHDNPVRRGLVTRPEEYLWSTAHLDRQGDVDWEMLA